MPNNVEEAYFNFKKAYLKLEDFIQNDDKSEMSRAAIIHAFECTFELWWKMLQRHLEKIGTLEEYGPNAVIKKAFQYGVIEKGQEWMDMLRDRNLTSHTYNESTAEDIYSRIITEHIDLLKEFVNKFDEYYG